MSLSSDAKKMVDVLKVISIELKDAGDKESIHVRSRFAVELDPLISRLSQAVLVSKSKEDAAEALQEISRLIDQVSSFAVRAEAKLFTKNIFNEFWDLKTIFQEVRYKNEPL